jgi:hypothetical protein
MTLDLLQQHWALLAAGIVGTAVVLFAAWRAWLDSPRGRLHLARKQLRAKIREARKHGRAGGRATVRLDRLVTNSDSVRPSRLEEATDAVRDAQALLKIANDQVLIAENHVRKIIVEEFPPKHHERMRRKYLAGGP